MKNKILMLRKQTNKMVSILNECTLHRTGVHLNIDAMVSIVTTKPAIEHWKLLFKLTKLHNIHKSVVVLCAVIIVSTCSANASLMCPICISTLFQLYFVCKTYSLPTPWEAPEAALYIQNILLNLAG